MQRFIIILLLYWIQSSIASANLNYDNQERELLWYNHSLINSSSTEDINNIKNKFNSLKETRLACQIELNLKQFPRNCFKWIKLRQQFELLNNLEAETEKQIYENQCLSWLNLHPNNLIPLSNSDELTPLCYGQWLKHQDRLKYQSEMETVRLKSSTL